jgi:LemA protein
MMSAVLRAALVAVLAFGLSACGINTVPTKEEAAMAQWANVEAAYQRRADLIPNLVSTVRASAASEEEILTDVIEARSRATAVQLDAGDLSDPQAVQQFQQAQGQLGSALSRLLVTVERYPQLASQQRFADLMVALEGAENRINTERTRYNEAVRDYNTTIRTFPAIVAANIVYGAEPLEAFTADVGADQAPTVDFGDDFDGGGVDAANDNIELPRTGTDN